MTWSSSSCSTRPPREDGYSMIGLASSRHTLICPELRKGNIRKANQFVVKTEVEDHYVAEELTNSTEKKRRLTADQVNFLEMHFSMDIKLDPERKAALAKRLGIRPRQVAIWFQNKRARWKSKQLEQNFEGLKANFEAVMNEKQNIMREREAVLEENKQLETEVLRLRDRLERMRNSRSSDATGAGSVGKSDITSPTKSTLDQGDIQDSGQSDPLVGPTTEMKAMVVSKASEQLDSGMMASANSNLDCDQVPVLLADELFGLSNFTLLFHPPTSSGVYFDDGLLSNYGDDHFSGLAFHAHMPS